jgi:hypothetical protein
VSSLADQGVWDLTRPSVPSAARDAPHENTRTRGAAGLVGAVERPRSAEPQTYLPLRGPRTLREINGDVGSILAFGCDKERAGGYPASDGCYLPIGGHDRAKPKSSATHFVNRLIFIRRGDRSRSAARCAPGALSRVKAGSTHGGVPTSGLWRGRDSCRARRRGSG